MHSNRFKPRKLILVMLNFGCLFLNGCVSPPTAYDASLNGDIDRLKNAPASIWVMPRNDRVTFHRHSSNDFEIILDEFPGSSPQPHDQNVCWAYCASQVLKYDGVDVSPEDLVEKVRQKRKGSSLRGDAGTALDIMRPLFGNGRYVGIYSPDCVSLARSLSFDSPIILALKPEQEGDVGHAVVLTGIEFSFFGQAALPSELEIYDPDNGRVLRIDGESGLRALWKRIAWCIYFTDFTRGR